MRVAQHELKLSDQQAQRLSDQLRRALVASLQETSHPDLDALTAAFDEMAERMSAAGEALENASPEELGRAAVEAVRRMPRE